MGVFARFFGKKQKASEEPRTPEEPEVKASAAAEPEGPAPENAAQEAAEAEAAPKGSGEDDGRDADARKEPDCAGAAADNTEIPKQQSAKEAADNEAGEDART